MRLASFMLTDTQMDELLETRWAGPDGSKRSPNVTKMTRNFNWISMWVANEILARETPKLRAKIIRFVIKTGLVHTRMPQPHD